MIGQSLSALKGKEATVWSLNVGRMHSRNNIIVRDDVAYFGTSGDQWNRPDQRDGIHCVDLHTASERWFTRTDSDANEVAIIGDVLLVGTDSGSILAIDIKTGAVRQSTRASGPVYTRALDLRSSQGQCAVIVCSKGEVFTYDLKENRFALATTLPYSVRANPVAVKDLEFLIATEGGQVIRACLDRTGAEVSWRPVFQILPYKASAPHEFELKIVSISSISVIDEDRVVLSYARDTYDRRPPLVCFSLKSGKKIWDGGRIQTASKTENSEFGNSRVTPIVWKDLIISTFSYNESVHAFSLENGKWQWRCRLDNSYMQNWSSPIVKDDHLFVARINGVISVVNMLSRKIIASYSVEVFNLEEADEAVMRKPVHADRWPNALSGLDSSGPYPSQQLVAGICSTPAIWRDCILIGTVAGQLRCVRSAGLVSNN